MKKAGEKEIVDVIRDAVDKGSKNIEEIHKSIASFPLKMLEEVDPLKKPLRELRKVLDRWIHGTYELVRDVNRRLGRFAHTMMESSAPMKRGRKLTPMRAHHHA